MSMFSNKTAQESQQEDKVISGKIVSIENNYIVIQDSSGQMPSEKEIILNSDTKIYHDFNSDHLKTEKVDKYFLKVNDDIVIGLVNSKNEIPLTAKAIHILPTN